MPHYRKKPVVIEAVQYGPHQTPSAELILFLEDGCEQFRVNDDGIVIETLEGNMTAKVGDWIIKGVSGEFYPCKPEIFEVTYEEAPDA